MTMAAITATAPTAMPTMAPALRLELVDAVSGSGCVEGRTTALTPLGKIYRLDDVLSYF